MANSADISAKNVFFSTVSAPSLVIALGSKLGLRKLLKEALMSEPIEFHDRALSLGLARVAEQAALASARLIGRGDEKAADQAAVNAMRTQLNMLDIAGVVVIGEGERDEAPMLFIGEEVGSGNGPAVDIALDPLEGTTLTAKDMPNALTVIAMGPRGSMLHAPDVYMEKLAVGPSLPENVVSLDMEPAERVWALAAAKNCSMAVSYTHLTLPTRNCG